MNCKDFRELADSYLSNELLVETNHEVLRHLENCPDCRRELASRRDLRTRLRDAVRRASQGQLNADFAVRLTDDLREKYLAKHSRWSFAAVNITNPVLAGILAILVFTASIGLVWKFGRMEKTDQTTELNLPTPNQTNTFTDEEKSSLQIHRASFVEMEQDAVGDHKHCALKFALKEKPISLDAAAKKYGKFNKDLEKAVFEPLKDTFGAKVKFLEAHSCIINGRRFAHVVIQYEERVISVLVAKREDNAETENSDAISCQSLEDLRIACFEINKFGVFVVSDLDETENLKLARTILSSVKRHFEQNEIKA